MNINKFKELPILGILRGIDESMIEPIVETVVSSGLKTIEIAMNTKDAAGVLKKMADKARGRLTIGAGTVIKMDDLHSAIKAGASFIVMPNCGQKIIDYCVKDNIPVFPGALTPHEIYSAWEAGATMVKIFPAKVFGPEYFKEIHGPFKEIKLLACGGVSPENIGRYFSCGASAVAFGGSVFNMDWMKAGKYHLVEEAIKALIAGLREKK